MQTLWPRAAQARHRGCRACSTALGAAGRRTAAAARRRKPTFADVFTACYSSMFATAAIVDAVQKEDRRRDLDRQLDEARKELSELQDRASSETPSKESLPTGLSIEQMDNLWRSLKEIYSNRPFMKEIDKPATVSVSALVSTLQSECYGCADEASMRAARRTNYKRLERAIMDDECDTSIVPREPRSKLHLLRDSVCIAQVVQRLLSRAEMLDGGSSPSPSFDEARELAEKERTNFTFQSIDPARARRMMPLLNRRLRSLVEAPELGLKEKIGRICFNLVVSAHPPDIHTYNTLIVAFDKAGHYALADALIHSFFHERLLRPTSCTFVAILNHYKVSGNHGKFLRALACITGLDRQTGAKLRRRHVNDIQNSRVLRKWAADTRLRTRTGDWVMDHLPLNGVLVEEILGGLVRFRLFDQAASFLVTCVQSGVAVSMSVARLVLDDVALALDWRAAVRLIRGLSSCTEGWEAALLTGDEAADAYLVGRIYSLLDLCGLGRTAASASRRLLDNLSISGAELGRFLAELDRWRLGLGLGLGLGVDGAAAAAAGSRTADTEGDAWASRLLQLEGLWKEYVLVRKTTASIESKLLQLADEHGSRAALALHIGSTAVDRSVQLGQELATLLEAGEARRAAATDDAARTDGGSGVDAAGLWFQASRPAVTQSGAGHEEAPGSTAGGRAVMPTGEGG